MLSVFSTAEELVAELETNNNHYHFRIHPNQQYIFFGDIDHFDGGIDKFIHHMSDFLLKHYNLVVETSDVKYTRNTENSDSYHYSIPKLNGSTEKLREIHSNFLKIKGDELGKKVIDTTVYSEHWFRCPNQYKGSKNGKNIHEIVIGNMLDFIVDHIPSHSLNINDSRYIDTTATTMVVKDKKPLLKLKAVESVSVGGNSQLIVQNNSLILSGPAICRELFDHCYKPWRFEMYEYWMKVGMALKNSFENEQAFNLFDYFSSKGNNYQGTEATQLKFQTFIKRDDGVTVSTIYYYAMEDNKPKFIEIMNQNTFKLEHGDICQYLKSIAGYKFIYKKNGKHNDLYCYNGKYWEQDEIPLRSFINNELYEFLKTILTEVYWNSKDFEKLKQKLEKLKDVRYKRDLVESYKENGRESEIEFDSNWNLLGFNNTVYDLEEGCFRNYAYSDYVATTTGYDWREPTEEELATVNDLIEKIMPIKDERDLYLQILSTTLEGRCLEKAIFFSGNGGNGKGMINDLLLLALGNYGLLANNSILFETSKTGSNPEKANIHQKRLVIFREPPAKNCLQNSVVKELTGGGKFSARTHHEHQTQKDLYLTMIIECNQKPLFAEEPKDAEVRRIIDMLFRSTFTTESDRWDEMSYIYPANPLYKTQKFQQQHKYALIKILMDAHRVYKQKEYILTMPASVSNRTMAYLELSCNIVTWFKDNFEYTEDKTAVIKVKDLYEQFTQSEYFYNLSKMDKRKYNKSFFTDYIQTNIFFKKYYCERTSQMKNFIKQWIAIQKERDVECRL